VLVRTSDLLLVRRCRESGKSGRSSGVCRRIACSSRRRSAADSPGLTAVWADSVVSAHWVVASGRAAYGRSGPGPSAPTRAWRRLCGCDSYQPRTTASQSGRGSVRLVPLLRLAVPLPLASPCIFGWLSRLLNVFRRRLSDSGGVGTRQRVTHLANVALEVVGSPLHLEHARPTCVPREPESRRQNYYDPDYDKDSKHPLRVYGSSPHKAPGAASPGATAFSEIGSTRWRVCVGRY
jgi:hypothetical protein